MLTGKGYWGDAGDKNYLGSDDKEEIMNQVRLVRDSPSEEEYNKREEKLFEVFFPFLFSWFSIISLQMTGEDSSHGALSVRPGQAKHPVTFQDYYNKNWKPCNFR